MDDSEKQELLDSLQSYFREVIGEEIGANVQEAYEDLLESNLDQQVGEVPETVREDLAEAGAEVYADQAQRLLASSYLGEDELDLAMATAFLDEDNEVQLAKKTRAVFRDYEDVLGDIDRDRYEKRARTVLNHPWPESHLGTGAERFKDPEDDRTFQ